MKDDSNLWNQLLEANTLYRKAGLEFINGCKEKNIVIKEALSLPTDRSVALRFLLLYLDASERKEFFEQLVALTSFAHGNIGLCREVILTLPRDFVLANIEKVSEPLLQTAEAAYQYEEYRRLLELYIEIDTNLTKRLAIRASQSDIEDIREAGEDFLALLDNKD